MATFIKAGLWIERITNIKGEFNLTKYIKDLIAETPPPAGDFIPLTGTTVGNPVSGDILIEDSVAIIPSGSGEFYLGDKNVGCIIISNTDALYLRADTNPNFRGIGGFVDYSPNITDLDYTQKIYVDSLKPYKVYTALLTQSGSNAPVANVLENTIGGSLVWSRADSGDYRLEGDNNQTFPYNKTVAFIGRNFYSSLTYLSAEAYAGGDRVFVGQGRFDNSGRADGLSNIPIEIRVYN